MSENAESLLFVKGQLDPVYQAEIFSGRPITDEIVEWSGEPLLYHGGIPGLEVGDELVDPFADPSASPRLWVTPSPYFARGFAQSWATHFARKRSSIPAGDLYQVAPAGPLRIGSRMAITPDGMMAIRREACEFVTTTATIVAVVERACQPISLFFGSKKFNDRIDELEAAQRDARSPRPL